MWQLKINDPSGETRILSLQGNLKGTLTLGRDASADIQLRDPTLPKKALLLWAAPSQTDSPYWMRALEDMPTFTLGDLKVRESHFPPDVSLKLGESTLILQKNSKHLALPEQPIGVRSWLTQSEEGRKTLWLTKKAATTPLSIYLAGETGTGKEVLAGLIHAWSTRASGAFVPINCGALPLSLAESELFGHVKGAFTGAVNHRCGALMQAHGGTLFLDEIGDLSLDIQVKLLRFLENGEIRPVGADQSSRVDTRLICATHQSLKKLVGAGKFRRDLYYRIASITIEIPPLHSRPEDIELLALKFANEMEKTLSPQALLRLQAYNWPGNVRELRHAIERASGISGPFMKMLGEDSFEFLLTPDTISEQPEIELGSSVLTLSEMERVLLIKALRLAKGNRRKAAQILGVARSTLFEMLKRFKIQGPKSHAYLYRPLLQSMNH
jgi:transcriptional regulator with PAS, ATPase and Fis domain